MLVRTLKKFVLILLVVVVYQNWGKIEHFFNPAQAVSSQVQSQAKVTLYATDWCGSTVRAFPTPSTTSRSRLKGARLTKRWVAAEFL
jgi:hypothetical protein